MPKIDPLGNMTPSISQKTFPPMVGDEERSEGQLMQYTNDYLVEVLGSVVSGIDKVLSLIEQRWSVCW